jgi:hypothetical protein
MGTNLVFLVPGFLGFGVDSKTAKETLVAKHAGLLHSGSQFRDEQFFELMRRIVDAIEPALLKPRR